MTKNIKALSISLIAALLIGAPVMGTAFTIKWDPKKPLDVTVNPNVKVPTPGEIVNEVTTIPKNVLRETGKAADSIVIEVSKGGKNVLTELGIGLGNVNNEVGKGYENIARETTKAILDIAAATDKAGKDAEATIAKAGKDVEWNVAKAGRDSENAVHAIGHFIERQAHSQGKLLNEASERFREGKFVDAFWVYSLGHFQETEDNAAKAAMESDLIATAGQVAAQAYGGPGGAAAYSAWLTYKQTGDLDLAMRTGIVTGASALAMAEAGEMPTKGADYALARKTVTISAIGGATVAAAGGDANAVREGFIKAGAMVLIQDHYQDVSQENLDKESMMSSKSGPAYCASVDQKNCRPMSADVIKDRRVPSVGLEGSNNPLIGDNGVVMKSLSKIPGMQGMSVMHDQWVVQWNLDQLNLNQATIAPAIVMYYTGTGAPYYEHLRRTYMERELARSAAKIAGKSVPKKAEAMFSQKIGVVVDPSKVSQSYLCTKGTLGRQFAVEIGKPESGFACRVVSNTSGQNSFARNEVYWKAKAEVGYCGKKAMQAAMRYEKKGWQCHFLPPAEAVAEKLAEQVIAPVS